MNRFSTEPLFLCNTDLTYDKPVFSKEESDVRGDDKRILSKSNPNIHSGSSANLTINFFTVISDNSYKCHNKHVTIRFKHKLLGSYAHDKVDTTVIGERVFDGYNYVKLKGKLTIDGEDLLNILNKSFKIHYKYFLNGVEEHLFHNGKGTERTVELTAGNKYQIDKYDQMPLAANQAEPHNYFSITSNIWRICLNLMLPVAPIKAGFEQCHKMEEFLFQSKTILENLCYSFFYANKKYFHWLSEKETLETREELVKDWLLLLINNDISVENYMYLFHLVFLIIEQNKLVSRCNQVYKSLFERINDLDMLKIIENRLWGKDRFLEPEKLLMRISKSVESLLFSEINRLIDTIRFFPLYHHVFDLFKEFEFSQENHDFPNEHYWGLPNTNGIPKYFTNLDLPFIQDSLTTFSGIDAIYPYSILILTCQKESLSYLLEMPEFPVDSFLSLLVFRIYKRDCSSCTNIDKCTHFFDSESRIKIYTFIILKLQSEAHNLSDRQVQILCDSAFWIWGNLEQQSKDNLESTLQECQELVSLTAHLLTELENRYKGEFSIDNLQTHIRTIRDSKSLIEIIQNIHASLHSSEEQSSSTSSDLFDQIKIWDCMLKSQFPQAYEWDVTVLIILTILMKRYDYRTLADVLKNLCQHDDLDMRITHLVQKLLIDFLTSQNSSDSDSKYIADSLEGVSTEQKKQIFSLYSTILLKQQNNFELDPFEHILTWNLWDTYFCSDLLPEHHPAKEESLQFITQAENTFLTLIEQLYQNEISFKTLHAILNNQSRVIILFQMQSTKYQVKHEIYRKMDVEKVINCKSEIFKYFSKRREEIRSLQNFIDPPLQVFEFSNFSSINFDEMSLHCVFNNEFVLLPGHEISYAINSPESQTMLSTSEYLCKSEIFNYVIQKLATTTEELLLPLCAAHFYEQFWLPSFNIVEELLESLISFSIPLSRVEEYLTDYKENKELALTELITLSSAVKLVSSKEITKRQLEPAVSKVIDYFRLRNAFDLGPIIIDIQLAYGFKGDFTEVVSLNNLMETSLIFKEQRLDSISDELLELAELLITFSELEKQIFKTFLAQREFIEWVHCTFRDRNELKVFTDLVHTFCIDEPLQTETNTRLYGICLDLAPLIFDIDRQFVNSRIFLATCKDVFEKIDTHEFLKVFEEATFTLWSQMKDTHASTLHGIREEIKSLMSESFFLKIEPGKRMNEIVTITMNGKDLNFIKELDNKITFLKDDEYVNCSLFRNILQGFLSLSTLIETLHLAGHINYRQYSLQLPCTLYSLNHINKLIQETTKLLKEWTQQLDKARKKYYYLNYYTPNQIVSLQIELYKFQSSGKLDMKHINLLSIIKPDVRVDEVISCMEKAGCPTSVNLCSRGNIFSSVDLEHELCKIIEIRPTTEKDIIISETMFPPDFTQPEKDLCEDISKRTVVEIETVIQRVDHLKRNRKEINRAQITRYCINLSTDDVTIEQKHITTKPSESKPKIKGSFVGLKNLGTFLQCLQGCNHEVLKISHKFPSNFREGMPNLVCVSSKIIIHTLLSLYLGPKGDYPLPYNNEVLFCCTETRSEEVDLFWRRALFDPNTNHLYCLVYIDKLVYQVAVKSVSQLNGHLNTQKHNNAKLVLLCTDQLENVSFMASSFQHCKREPPTELIEMKLIQQKLFNKFSYRVNRKLSISQSSLTPAFNADPDQSYIRLVVSKTVGAGKSLAIQRLVSDLKSFQEDNWKPDHYNIISVHGDRVNEKEVLERLKEIKKYDNGQIYHFDIASSVREELVPFLFKLLILGVISDFSGNIWCCNRKNYYVVELLFMQELKEISEFGNLFPLILCHQPGAFVQVNTNFNTNDRIIDDQLMRSSKYQHAFAYLDRKVKEMPLDNFHHVTTTDPTYSHEEFIKTIISNCGVKNPSWSELNHFITFFSNQMSACDKSDFYRTLSVEGGWEGFKSFIVKYMIIMSRDFATPSIGKNSSSYPNDILLNYSVHSRRKWEQQTHPYIYFNQDQHSMTFLGFNIKHGNLIDIKDPSLIIEKNIIPEHLENLFRSNGLFQKNPYRASKEDWIAKLQAVIGFAHFNDPDEHYVLTLDNVMKILAIHMRFRYNIPVIIMGETGCGKTKLLQYMSSLQINAKRMGDERTDEVQTRNMILLKMHGGTTMADVISKLKSAIDLAKENFKQSKDIDTVLFFDEANTSSSIGLIKEILCDRRYNGKTIPSNIRLQFVATCNPYRRHTSEMIKKLNSAGLGHFKHHLQKTEQFGGIPLRELVYRVMEIPPSLLPLVWNFGQLSPEIEHLYIQQIVRKHLHNSQIKCYGQYHQSITRVLAATQIYLRKREDECSFVSLRDIGRCMRVMLWFHKQLEIFEIEESCLDKPTYSLILAIGVCYRAKLIDREQLDIDLTLNIERPLNTFSDASVINREILKFQTVITDHMTIDEHIAKNAALKENIFMMFVCIELRIPLFLIGKPGSSKSLAKSIICHSMEGQSYRSKSKLRNFKEVYMVSYQCSQLSTSDGINKVFTACKDIQRGKTDKLVACAVLDEIGLAENCPSLPLKLLHPLLEEPSDSGDCQVAGNSVAFLGISNWALDPAKMNRGIMVSLQEPTEDELVKSANAICKSTSGDNMIHFNRIKPHIPGLARGYIEICDIQKSHIELSSDYFGLRDFYSLVKMIYYLCMKNNTELNNKILLHTVTRNFGGLTGIDAFRIFRDKLKLDEGNDIGPSSTWLELIRTNINCTEDSLFGKTRYLLLLTDNLIALNIIIESGLLPQDYKTIFGSAFSDSNDSTVVYRHILEIKNCMETGRTLVLLNLSYLYESLYDTLNQYFLRALGRRWVDIGLGTNRMKCPVDPKFKLIVIADREKVYSQFPSPLINRFEKHTLTMSTVLSLEENEMVRILADWAASFSKTEKTELLKSEYLEGDCFIGFQQETPPLIVYSVVNQQNESKDDENYLQNTLEKCKLKLLMMATPDSILRLLHTSLKDQSNSIRKKYIDLHILNLVDYMHTLPTRLVSEKNTMRAKFESPEIQRYYYSLNIVTTHSAILTEEECQEIEKLSNVNKENYYKLHQLNLIQFQSEEHFVKTISEFISKPKKGVTIAVLIIQCENGHIYTEHVLYAMHKVKEELFQAKNELFCDICLVFIIKLPRIKHGTKFSSYYGGEWDTVHVDELKSQEEGISFNQLSEISIADLFNLKQTDKSFLLGILRRCVQPAVLKSYENAKDTSTLDGRVCSFNAFLGENNNELHSTLLLILSNIFVRMKSAKYTDIFARSVALNEHALQSAGTYNRAILQHIIDSIVPVLAGVISYFDINQNLKLLQSLTLHEKEIPTRTIWCAVFTDKNNIFDHTEAILHLSSTHSHFESSFPFSWLIIPHITDQLLLAVSNPELESVEDFELSFEKTNIANMIIPIIHQQRNFMSIYLYLEDFISFCLTTPESQMIESERSVYRIMLTLEASRIRNSLRDRKGMEIFFDRSGFGPKAQYLPDLTIPNFHVAYEKLKNRLIFVKQAFYNGFISTSDFESIITESRKHSEDIRSTEQLESLDVVIFRSIIEGCKLDLDNIINAQITQKHWIEKVRQFQYLIDNNWNIVFPNFEDQLQLRQLWNGIIAIDLIIRNLSLHFSLKSVQQAFNQMPLMVFDEETDFHSRNTFENILAVLMKMIKNSSREISKSHQLICVVCQNAPIDPVLLKCKQVKCRTCTVSGQGTYTEADSIGMNSVFGKEVDEQKFKYFIKEQNSLITSVMRYLVDVMSNISFSISTPLSDEENLINLLFEYITLNQTLYKDLNPKDMILFQEGILKPMFPFRMFLLQLLLKERYEVVRSRMSDFVNLLVPKEGPPDLHATEIIILFVHCLEDSYYSTQYKLPTLDKQIDVVIDFCTTEYSFQDCSTINVDYIDSVAKLKFIAYSVSKLIIRHYDLRRDYMYRFLKTTNNALQIPFELQNLIGHFKSLSARVPEMLTLYLFKCIFYQLGWAGIISLMNKALIWILPIDCRETKYYNLSFDPFSALIPDNIHYRSMLEKHLSTPRSSNQLIRDRNRVSQDMEKIEENIVYSVFKEIYIKGISNNTREISTNERTRVNQFLRTFLPNSYQNMEPFIDQLLSGNGFLNGTFQDLLLSPLTSVTTRIIVEILCHLFVLLRHSYQDPTLINFLSPLILIYSDPSKLHESLFPAMPDTQEELKGHILGNPFERQIDPPTVRNISAVTVSIIRALIHGIFILSATISNLQTPSNLTKIITNLTNLNLFHFYALHLFKDLTDLSVSTGKYLEEVAIIIHLVIDAIIHCKPLEEALYKEMTSINFPNNWELMFDKLFISPILSKIDTKVQNYMSVIRKDKKIEEHPVLRILFESDVTAGDISSIIWCYRSVIDSQHFTNTLFSRGLKKEANHPFLAKFLNNRNLLSAIRSLPDIVKLMIKLSQKKYIRIIKREGTQLPINKFIEIIQYELGRSEKNELEILVSSYRSAWSIISRVFMQDKRFNQSALDGRDREVSLACLVPYNSGDEPLIVIVANILINTHNSIVEASHGRNSPETTKASIPLSMISSSHMIDCEDQLDSLVLSCARYSLKPGQGAKISYDYMTIERHIMDKFVRSKPTITNEIYSAARQDVLVNSFKKVKEQIPQLDIEKTLQDDIYKSLSTPERVSYVLEQVEVAIKFIASMGGQPDMKIYSYLHSTLKYPISIHQFSSAISQFCCLKHIIHLWKILSVLKAKLLAANNQYPFGSLPHYFYLPLTPEQKRHIMSYLPSINTEYTLNIIHDYIVFYMQTLSADQANSEFFRSFREFANETDIQIPEEFKGKIFRQDISVSNAVSLWLFIAREASVIQ